ncbi:MAG: GAF domain-containing protein, partial [Chloroflexi bacterium]|nr:GAF domain-containing protein [Chloroflexota bacterium]
MIVAVGVLGCIAVACAVGWLVTYRTAAQHARQHAELKQSLGVVDVDRRVLELVAGGASVQTVLDTLTHSIEKLATDVHCTILLLDEDGKHLRKGAGPSLPPSYMDAVDGLEIGPEVGACGTAAFTNQTVVVEDVATDPKFAAAKDLLLGYDLRACWSVPIRDSKRAVLGTFAMYHRKPASPRNFEIGLVEAAAHLAGNAIERLRTEQRLASVAERLDIAERTAAFGIWELDLQSHAVAVSAGLARVLGWTAIPA